MRNENQLRKQLRRFEREDTGEEALKDHLQNGLVLLCQALNAPGGFVAVRRGDRFVTMASQSSLPVGGELPESLVACEEVSHPRAEQLAPLAWIAPSFDGAQFSIRGPEEVADFDAHGGRGDGHRLYLETFRGRGGLRFDRCIALFDGAEDELDAIGIETLDLPIGGQLAEQNWVVAQKGVDVKLVPSPDGQETFLLARSVDRRSKELAMHEKFIGHMQTDLVKLKAAAESGRLRDETLAGERLGRLNERFWRASQAFDVTIRKLPQPIGTASGSNLGPQREVPRLVAPLEFHFFSTLPTLRLFNLCTSIASIH